MLKLPFGELASVETSWLGSSTLRSVENDKFFSFFQRGAPIFVSFDFSPMEIAEIR